MKNIWIDVNYGKMVELIQLVIVRIVKKNLKNVHFFNEILILRFNHINCKIYIIHN